MYVSRLHARALSTNKSWRQNDKNKNPKAASSSKPRKTRAQTTEDEAWQPASSPKPQKKRAGGPLAPNKKSTPTAKKSKNTPCSTAEFFSNHPLQRPKWFIKKNRNPRRYKGDLVEISSLDPKSKPATSWYKLQGIPRDFPYNNHHGPSAVIPGENVHSLFNSHSSLVQSCSS